MAAVGQGEVVKRNAPDKKPRTAILKGLFAPVDAASVVFFRVSFGLLMIWHFREYFLADKVHVFTRTNILFKFYGFEWVRPGPEWAMRMVFWLLAAASLGIALGLLYRLSAIVFFSLNVYVLLLDIALINNHDYLIALFGFLLIFVPAHRHGSLDATLKPKIRSPTVPAWALWLLRFQVGVPYFFGALAKLNGDWMLRAQPMTLWLETGGAGGDLLPDFMRGPRAGYFFSWSGFLLDLLIVPCLLYRRTRLAAYLVIVTFHCINSYIFDIGVFPWLMICATAIFFPPGWPRRVGLAAKRAAPRKRQGKPPEELDRRQRLTVALLGAYVALQVLLPFRHLLYPGNVDWTEEGIYFAWRMKLRDKRGDMHLVLLDRKTRKATVYRDFDKVLTPRQHLHIVHDPDMLLQFVHHVARLLHEKGEDDFEIRAVTNISFNGREPQPIVDPNVDLAAQRRGLGAASWMMPLKD